MSHGFLSSRIGGITRHLIVMRCTVLAALKRSTDSGKARRLWAGRQRSSTPSSIAFVPSLASVCPTLLHASKVGMGACVLAAVFASTHGVHAQPITSPTVAAWPLQEGSPAFGSMSATVNLLIDPNTGQIRGKASSSKISFSGAALVGLVPTIRVSFGPIRLRFVRATGDPEVAIFRVRILGRPPSLLGTASDLKLLGVAGKALGGAKAGAVFEDSISLTVDLPGVFTAIQLVGEVEIRLGSTRLWSQAIQFPSARCGEVGRDSECLQAAVNPTGVIAPNVFPIAILYEPPGNCSWAKFTQTSTVGVATTIEQSERTTEGRVTTTRALPVLPFEFGGLGVNEETHTSEEKETLESDRSSVRYTQSGTVGTRFAPGNPRCATGEHVPDTRETNGPGKGDIFVLVTNPQFVFWETNVHANFRQPTVHMDGFRESEERFVTARDLARNEINGRPLPFEISDAGRLALLSLDPFFDVRDFRPPNPFLPNPGMRRFFTPIDPDNVPGVDLPFRGKFAAAPQRLDPFRFVPLPVPKKCLDSPGLLFEQVVEKNAIVYNTTTLKNAYSSTGTVEERDRIEKAAKLVLQAGAAAILIKTQGLKQTFGSFKAIDEYFSTVGRVGELFDKFGFKNAVETTTTVTFTRSKLLEKSTEQGVTQEFHIRDTNRPLCIRPYYDTFFGSLAFQEVPAAMGSKTPSAAAAQRPEFSNPITLTLTQSPQVRAEIPLELKKNLKVLGEETAGSDVHFQLAPLEDFEVAEDLIQGLPLGLQLDPSTGTLGGRLHGVAPGNYQALVYVSDEDHQTFAELWLNIEVSTFPEDLDSDGDVDNDDLKLLLEDLNTSVSDSACGAPCDLNEDGVITALDARLLVTRCTRPRCATQ